MGKLKPAQIMEKAIKDNGFNGYEKEYYFHPKRKWRFDFAWTDVKVAVEVHGGVFTSGRHTRGKGFEKDREKMNTAQVMGWVVLEVTPNQILDMKAERWLGEVLKSRRGIL